MTKKKQKKTYYIQLNYEYQRTNCVSLPCKYVIFICKMNLTLYGKHHLIWQTYFIW